MKKNKLILLIIYFLTNSIISGQEMYQSDENIHVAKASYVKGDLISYLQKEIDYPMEAIKRNLEGNVRISFVVTTEGKLDSVLVFDSPNVLLSTKALLAFMRTENHWTPAKFKDNPINRKYSIIFGFRIYNEAVPVSNKMKADKYFKKGKLEKALKYYDKAIQDNRFNYELFESRAKVREISGMISEAQEDRKTVLFLKNNIIAVVDIIALGIKRTVKRQLVRKTEVRRY